MVYLVIFLAIALVILTAKILYDRFQLQDYRAEIVKLEGQKAKLNESLRQAKMEPRESQKELSKEINSTKRSLVVDFEFLVHSMENYLNRIRREITQYPQQADVALRGIRNLLLEQESFLRLYRYNDAFRTIDIEPHLESLVKKGVQSNQVNNLLLTIEVDPALKQLTVNQTVFDLIFLTVLEIVSHVCKGVPHTNVRIQLIHMNNIHFQLIVSFQLSEAMDFPTVNLTNQVYLYEGVELPELFQLLVLALNRIDANGYTGKVDQIGKIFIGFKE